jgi:hypothetical protein
MSDLGFFTWYHDLSDSQFTAIVLPNDADEVTASCPDGDWYICHLENPASLKTPFVIQGGAVFTLVPAIRVVKANSVIAYARSLTGALTLRCFATSPSPGTRNSLLDFPE